MVAAGIGGKDNDMRIIKEGKLPPKEKKMKCSKCGCVFIYDHSDIKSYQREGSWVVCPTCKSCITVECFSYMTREQIEKQYNKLVSEIEGKKKLQKIAPLPRSRRGYSVTLYNTYFTGEFVNTGIANWSTCPQCMQ